MSKEQEVRAKRRPDNKGRKFVIAKMRDVVADCTDSLHAAIAEQNPNIDADALETDLRALVQKHGTGNTNSVKEAAVAEADEQPEYNFAGDLLAIAYQAALDGNWQSAFRSFASAVAAEDMEDLIHGIEGMNAQTKVAQDAESLDDSDDMGDSEEVSEDEIDDAVSTVASEMDESDDGDEFAAEDEAEDELVEDDDAESDDSEVGDYSEEPDDEEELGDEEVTAEDEEVFSDDEPESDEDSAEPDEDDGVPMGGASSRPTPATASVEGRLKAIANKLSLSGDDESRKEAGRVLKRK